MLTITPRQLPAKFSIQCSLNPQRLAIVCFEIVSGVISSLCIENVKAIMARGEKIYFTRRYRTRLQLIFYVGTCLFAQRLRC